MSIGPEEEAVGVQKKQIGTAGDAEGTENLGGVAAGDAAEDVGDAGWVIKVDALKVADVEFLKAVEKVGAPRRAAFDQVGG